MCVTPVIVGEGISTTGDGGDAVIGSGNSTGSGVDGDIVFKTGNNLQFTLDDVQGIHAVNAGGPSILNEAAGFTNPTLVPDRGDLDTGIGYSGTDQLSLVVGGVSG